MERFYPDGELCFVRPVSLMCEFLAKGICALPADAVAPPQLGAVGALIDHLIRERAVGDLSGEGLEVRGIELLTLYVSSTPLSESIP